MSERVEKSGLQVDAALAAVRRDARCWPRSGATPRAFWAGFADAAAPLRPAQPRAARQARRAAGADRPLARRAARQAARRAPPTARSCARSAISCPSPTPFAIGTAQRRSRDRDAWPGRSWWCRCSTRASCSTPPMRAGAASTTPLRHRRAADAPPARRAGLRSGARRGGDRGGARVPRRRACRWSTGSWAEIAGPRRPRACASPTSYVGRTAKGLLFCNNGLHIEVVFDREHPIGRDDPRGHRRRRARSRADHDRRPRGFGRRGRCRGQARSPTATGSA